MILRRWRRKYIPEYGIKCEKMTNASTENCKQRGGNDALYVFNCKCHAKTFSSHWHDKVHRIRLEIVLWSKNKLFVSLSVKVTVYLASDVVIRLICAYYDNFVLSSGLLLFDAYYS